MARSDLIAGMSAAPAAESREIATMAVSKRRQASWKNWGPEKPTIATTISTVNNTAGKKTGHGKIEVGAVKKEGERRGRNILHHVLVKIMSAM